MPDDLRDRVERGGAQAIVTDAAYADRFDVARRMHLRLLAAGAARAAGSRCADAAAARAEFVAGRADERHRSAAALLHVGHDGEAEARAHTHVSYPIGHLSTMYWLGLQPGDVHLNLSSPGWAKHAWSSFFAPWNAEATIVVDAD